MKSYKIDVIDINSILPHFILKSDGSGYKAFAESKTENDEVILEEIKVIVSEEKSDDNQSEYTDDLHNCNYSPDENLGNLGEEYIEKMLLTQKEKSSKISDVERVSITQRNKSPGYDLEVRMFDNSVFGIEIKATRIKSVNRIHLTNNEIRAMLKLKENSFLVIVVFDNKTDKVLAIYKICNFIETLNLNIEKIQEVISTKDLNKIQFYPQVFVINIPSDIIEQYKLGTSDNIIKI